jgi:hypothetical protein
MYWFNDGLGRLAGGVIAYFLVNTINSYLFLVIFTCFSMIGHILLFMILSLNINGVEIVLPVAVFMALGAGASWVLVA